MQQSTLSEYQCLVCLSDLYLSSFLFSFHRVYPSKPGDHSPKALRATFLTSLKSLNRSKTRVLYLHAPDRSVPFEDTLSEVNQMHKEGLLWVGPCSFTRFNFMKYSISEIFGLSNFAAWEVSSFGCMLWAWINFCTWKVAEVVTICKKNGWVQPKIYQACVHRTQILSRLPNADRA